MARILFTVLFLLPNLLFAIPGDKWQLVEKGLEIGEFYAADMDSDTDSAITVIRIAPDAFYFELFAASADSSKPKTVREWSREHDLIAVVNGGMFQEDHSTSVGYFKSSKHLNNGHFNRNNCLLVSGPKKPGLPKTAILDRTCDNVTRITEEYEHILQSIRMIDCKGKNTWKEQPQKWSIVLVGQDKKGNILLIHNQTPFTVHHLVNMLLSLPIGLRKAMYLEGGAEAALYLNAGPVTIERFSKTHSSLFKNDSNGLAWPIPNVIGIRRRD